MEYIITKLLNLVFSVIYSCFFLCLNFLLFKFFVRKEKLKTFLKDFLILGVFVLIHFLIPFNLRFISNDLFFILLFSSTSIIVAHYGGVVNILFLKSRMKGIENRSELGTYNILINMINLLTNQLFYLMIIIFQVSVLFSDEAIANIK